MALRSTVSISGWNGWSARVEPERACWESAHDHNWVRCGTRCEEPVYPNLGDCEAVTRCDVSHRQARKPENSEPPMGSEAKMYLMKTLSAAVVLGAATTPHLSAQVGPVQPVASVDLAQYMGLWHEVARLPNSFQDECARETTAEYTKRPDGEIQVINSCMMADGTKKVAEGRAKLAHANGPTSELKVRFAPKILSWLPMVWGDYWILDLTDDYTAALVGTPDRKYLWILSRTSLLDSATFARMTTKARAQGFDVRSLIKAH